MRKDGFPEKPPFFNRVIRRELDQIVRRRRRAGFELDDSVATPSIDQQDALRNQVGARVGLALSGGGIRSGSFNLGMLQGLYEAGLLRHVDYLSTVSGGGYAGAFFSSLACQPPSEVELTWRSRPDAANEESPDDQRLPHDRVSAGSRQDEARQTDSRPPQRFIPSPTDNGRQPPLILQLIHSGMYLRRPLLFFNRYVLGLISVNLVAFSALLAAMVALAFLYRCLDYRDVINFLSALGFRGDLQRSLVPAILFFVLWIVLRLVASAIRCFYRCLEQLQPPQLEDAERRLLNRTVALCYRLSHRIRVVSRWLLVGSLVFLVLALVALLMTGDISFSPGWSEFPEVTDASAIQALQQSLIVIIVALVVIGLLPYFRLGALIRSGTDPQNTVQRWVFNAALTASLCGIPLLLFGVFVRENVSDYNQQRSGQHALSITDIADWPLFWNRVEYEAALVDNDKSDTRSIYAPSKWLWDNVDQDKVRQVTQRHHRIMKVERSMTLFKRLGGLARFLFDSRRRERTAPRVADADQNLKRLASSSQGFADDAETNTNCFKILWCANRQQDNDKKDILQQLNQQLRSPDSEYWHAFRAIKRSDQQRGLSNANQLIRLRDRAEGCALQLQENPADVSSRQEDLERLNRLLMQAYYGAPQLRRPGTVFAYNVVEEDQRYRLNLLGWLLLTFTVSALVINLNATSLHAFYRDQLMRAWIVRHRGNGTKIPFSKLDTCSRGAPYLLVNAAINLFQKDASRYTGPTENFLFSHLYVGSVGVGYRRTNLYYDGKYDLGNAMALSGAAVSPVSAKNRLIRVLLFLTNWRLGQWLPNPSRMRTRYKLLRWLAAYPCPFRVFIGWLVRQPRDQANCFISDGGIHDNLGIEALLERRCRVIIASDASADPDSRFTDFLKLIRRMRVLHGIKITGLSEHDELLPLDHVIATETDGTSRLHSILCEIRYAKDDNLPEAVRNIRKGYLIYIKPTFTGDESPELERYRIENRAFPNDPTLDQFYDPRRFESYRNLGYHIAKKVCADVTPNPVPDDQQPWLAEWSPGRSRQNNRLPTRAFQLWDVLATEQNQLRWQHALNEDDDPEKRAIAALALGESASPHASANNCGAVISSLLECAAHETDDVVLHKVIWALGEFAEMHDQSRIADVLEDIASADQRSESVRRYALRVLEHIRQRT